MDSTTSLSFAEKAPLLSPPQHGGRAISDARSWLLPALGNDDRECDDRYRADGEDGDIEGFGTHLKQPGVPAGQRDTLHGSHSRGCADEQATQAPRRLTQEAHHQARNYSDHHNQQRPLAQ
jgi:hypothetical protein